MSDSVEIAVQKARLDAHEKYCDERSERVAQDLSAVRTTGEKLAAELKDTATRVHQRVDDINGAMTSLGNSVGTMKEKVEALPETIASHIKIAMQGSKLDTIRQYGSFVMSAVAIIGLIWEIFGKK